MNCDACWRPATIHVTEIRDGCKTERHLCEDCMAVRGPDGAPRSPSISELLAKFEREHGPRQDGDRT